MARLKINKEMQYYIREQYLQKSGYQIAKDLGIEKSIVYRFYRKHNLIVPPEKINEFRSKSMKGNTTCTVEDDRIIMENYMKLPPSKIARLIGGSKTRVICRIRQLGLVIPDQVIQDRINNSQFKEGSIPLNKGLKWDDYLSPETQEKCRKHVFKKGNLPHNAYNQIGKTVIRERTKEKYMFICLSLGKWDLLHKVNWEKANGKIPKGHCLWCLNGDTLNCDPSNWELITRSENLKRNNLVDTAIASRLARVKTGAKGFIDREAQKEYLKNPELIQLKRQQLQLSRQIIESKRYGK